MFNRVVFQVLAVVLVAFSSSSQASESNITSCTVRQKNIYAGPFYLCQEPMSEAACKELGETEENSNAQYSKGACKQAGLVGSCIYPSYQQHFYSGNFAALEISCGFMDGKWVAG